MTNIFRRSLFALTAALVPGVTIAQPNETIHDRIARAFVRMVETSDREVTTARFNEMMDIIIPMNLPMPEQADVDLLFSDSNLIPEAFLAGSKDVAEIAEALKSLPDSMVEVMILRVMLTCYHVPLRTRLSPQFYVVAEKLRPLLMGGRA